MKIKLTFLFAVLCLTGFSQVEWAPIGAEWYYTYREGAFTPSAGYYKLGATKDTIIDSKKCFILTKQLVSSLGEESFQGQEYIYNDTINNRVFRYLFGQFYLLYDFSKEVGDTIVIKEPLSATEYDSIVVKVDSISYDDYSDQVRLKSQYVSVIFDLRSKWDFFGKNTEKLGNQYYFFPTNQLECDGGCPQPLRCYSDKDLEYHQYYSWLPCDTIYTYSEMPDKLNLRIYPVPFENFLTIETGTDFGKNCNIELFNNSGILVLRQSSFFDRIVLDMTHFDTGCYIIRIRTKENVYIKKIIKN